MKLLTCYTESHRVFLRSFFGSLDQSNGLDVVIRQHPQECPTGAFADAGWNDTTKRKFEFIEEQMHFTPEGEPMIFSDVDIQFFQPLTQFAEKALKEVDVVFQNDYYGHACTGFFYIRNNQSMRDLISEVIFEIPNWRDDQEAMNKVLIKNRSYNYGLLPPQFFTFGSFFKHWEGEQDFPLPPNIVMHHANWVKGVDKKVALLKTVRSIYERNRLP